MPLAAMLVVFKKFWFVLPILGMAFVILFMKADIASKEASLTSAKAANADLTKANANAKQQIDNFAAQRIDNDAIWADLTARLGKNTLRETNTRTVIEKAGRDDPKVNDWNNTIVPDGVRRALQAN